MMNDTLQFLDHLHIPYKIYFHPAVYSCEESERYKIFIEGISNKSLFLKTTKNERYFLVIIPCKKRLDFKKLESTLRLTKLTFGSPDELQRLLRLKPGAVSPLGLIYDTQKRIQLVMDKHIWNHSHVQFHPCVNTATLSLTKSDFEIFIEMTVGKYKVVEL